jgi:hypothetical protein
MDSSPGGPGEVRQVLVDSVRSEVRRKSVATPEGAIQTLAIDGRCLWRGRRGGCLECQVQGSMRVHRVLLALLTSARPRLFLDQRTLVAAENEMGAFAAFWAQLLQTYGRLHLFELVTLEAGYCSLANAILIDAAGYGYVLGLKENQPELWREAQRLLLPLAASQRPEAKVLERGSRAVGAAQPVAHAGVCRLVGVAPSTAGLAGPDREVYPTDHPAC